MPTTAATKPMSIRQPERSPASSLPFDPPRRALGRVGQAEFYRLVIVVLALALVACVPPIIAAWPS